MQIIQTAHQALEVTDPITVGVHVCGDRQAIDHGIFVPEIFDHTIAPEFPPAINDVSRERFPAPHLRAVLLHVTFAK